MATSRAPANSAGEVSPTRDFVDGELANTLRSERNRDAAPPLPIERILSESKRTLSSSSFCSHRTESVGAPRSDAMRCGLRCDGSAFLLAFVDGQRSNSRSRRAPPSELSFAWFTCCSSWIEWRVDDDDDNVFVHTRFA